MTNTRHDWQQQLLFDQDRHGAQRPTQRHEPTSPMTLQRGGHSTRGTPGWLPRACAKDRQLARLAEGSMRGIWRWRYDP